MFLLKNNKEKCDNIFKLLNNDIEKKLERDYYSFGIAKINAFFEFIVITKKEQKEKTKFFQYAEVKTSGDNSERLVCESFENFFALGKAILVLFIIP